MKNLLSRCVATICLFTSLALNGCNKTYTYETANEDVKGAYNLQELAFILSCTSGVIERSSLVVATTYCRCVSDILKSKFDFSPFKTQNILEESNNRIVGAAPTQSEMNSCSIKANSQNKTTVSM